MSVVAACGDITIVVWDDDAVLPPRLQQDSMSLALVAGPASQLNFGAVPGQLPTHVVLRQVTVFLADQAGNLTHDGSHEVSTY